jgi:hypothetical protein
MTTQTEIESAQLINIELYTELKSKFNFIDLVIVDDYGRFGNFTILIYLKNMRQGMFGKGIAGKLKGIVNKVIKNNNGILRNIYFPVAEYKTNYWFKNFERYSNRYISIDLDFRNYNKLSNTFN